MMDIRNFCILAHIDHGKSTLADRLLEITGTVPKDKLQPQLLDSLALERERGITIKLAPVRLRYTINDIPYTLNLIDTPGHVDFSYEVSRALAAVEGAVLLVDATQGIQAQTLAHGLAALEQNLTLIPVINKIDLPNADIENAKKELIESFGFSEDEILLVSGKTGQGVDKLLEEIVKRIPAPRVNTLNVLKALIFNSFFDSFKGVIAQVRIVEGQTPPVNAPVYFLQTKGLVLAVLLTFFFPYVYRKKMITGRALIIFTIGNYVFVILGYLLWKNEVLANFILSISGYMEIHKILYLYPAAMIGFLIFIIRPLLSKNKDNVALYLLFWLQIGLIASVMNQPDVYHLGINAFPLLILAAYSLQKSQLASKKIIYGALLVSLYAILMGNLIYIKSTGNWKMHVQHLRIFSEVKKIVKDEKIFAYPFIPQYYFFLQKQNPYYDSILLEKFSPKEHFQINLDILKKEKPKYILTQYNFTKRYGHSMNNVIDAYIRDSYVQTYSLGALEVWEKIE